MGTRGFVGLVVGEQVKIGYNHYDSYPEYLGVNVFTTVCRWMSGDEIEKRVQQAQDLRLVQDDDRPTPEDRIRLAAHRAPGVGEADSWYELLRDTQGDLDATLDCGVMIDAEDFPLDSLYCEWGYLVDLDRRKLEVYEGFQKVEPSAGRWAGRGPMDEDRDRRLGHNYYPCNRIVEFDLGALPGDKEEFLRVVKAHRRKEDN